MGTFMVTGDGWSSDLVARLTNLLERRMLDELSRPWWRRREKFTPLERTILTLYDEYRAVQASRADARYIEVLRASCEALEAPPGGA